MKILYCTDSLGAGGAERQLSLLCNELQSSNHDIMVISLDKNYYSNILHPDIDLRHYLRAIKYDITPLFRILNAVKHFKPDIIHTWGWMSTFACKLPARIFSIPLISSIRSGTKPKKRLVSILENRLADYIISNSQAGIDVNNISSCKSSVVYNGYDIRRKALEPNPFKAFTVVMVARMTPEKDWKCFIESIRIVNKLKQDKVLFVGLGDGPDRSSIIEFGRELIDSGVLLLPGFSEEPLEWLAKANVGVLVTSNDIQEGTSNSILEYMASSLPTICTNTGGNLETVINGNTGFLIDPGDSEALAAKIIDLYHNPEYAHHLGSQARNRLVNVYSIDNLISNTLDVYKAAIRDRQ